MTETSSKPTSRGSFRSQWALTSRTAPADVQRFHDSIAPWTNATTVDEFASSLTIDSPAAPEAPPPVKASFLADIARSFHQQAGTYTRSVQEQIEEYNLGRKRTLRVAHQPNFLPSVNVVGQAAVSSALAERLPQKPAQVFLVIDYDVNTDRRYRHALLPSMSSHRGYHSISVPLADSHKDTFIFSERKPDDDDICQLLDLLHTYTSSEHAIIRQLCGYSALTRYERNKREDSIRDHVVTSFRRGATLAEANAIFLSRFVNLDLGLPTIFIPGSLALEGLVDHISYLWSLGGPLYDACHQVASELEDMGVTVSPSLVPDEDVAPFWTSCSRDAARIRMYWTDRYRTKAKGSCNRCKADVVVTPKSLGDFLGKPSRAALIPRVLWDDLLDSFAWRHVAGCSYRGGLEHYLFTARLAGLMGLAPLPEFLSEYKAQGPFTDYEHAARVFAKEQASAPTEVGARKAWKVARSGQVSIAYSMMWAPHTVASLKHSFFRDDR